MYGMLTYVYHTSQPSVCRYISYVDHPGFLFKNTLSIHNHDFSGTWPYYAKQKLVSLAAASSHFIGTNTSNHKPLILWVEKLIPFWMTGINGSYEVLRKWVDEFFPYHRELRWEFRPWKLQSSNRVGFDLRLKNSSWRIPGTFFSGHCLDANFTGIISHTIPETNIALENGWLQY